MSENEVIDDSIEQVEETPVVESTDTRDIVEKAFEQVEQEEPEKESVANNVVNEAAKEDTEVKTERDPWKSWKPDAAEKLRGLPEDVQKMIADRQDQFHNGLEQYKDAANYAKSIDKSIAPFKDYLSQLGVTPEVAFPNLLKTEKTLRTGSPQEKVEMFQKLAYDYGIDLGVLADIPYDANMHKLKQQLDWTQSQLDAASNFRQSHEDVQIQSSIDDFGQQHEYFDDVRLTMADLLDKGLATDLNDAYAKAVRLDENVFQKQQARQQVGSQRQAITQADHAAKAAKASAVSVKGSPVSAKTTVLPATTEDAVRQAMKAHGL
jgi:hypothetical protein